MEDFEHGIISAVGSAWLGTLITAVVIIVITAVVGHLLTKFLRATGQATPAYAGALVAATEGLDAHRPDVEA